MVENDNKYLSYLATKRPTLPWVALLEAQDFTTRGNGSRQKDLHEYLGRIAPELNFELGPLYSNLRQRI